VGKNLTVQQSLSQSRNSPPFTEPESSLPLSQQLVTEQFRGPL